MTIDWDRVLDYAVVVVVVALMVFIVWTSAHAQTRRHGEPLPSGPPKYYLREGSPQWICAPYGDPKKPSWSCVDRPTAIALILKDPPDCGHAEPR